MTRFRMALLTILLALGFAVGSASAPSVEATTYTFHVWNHPGTQSTTAQLNCGWHSTCLPGYPLDGPGLDWSHPTAGMDVKWRSLSSNDQSYGLAGTVQVQDGTSGSCNTTYAALYSPLGSSLNRIQYLHTSPYGATGYTNIASGFWPQSTEFQVGDTVSNDCGSFPAHLHQERDSSGNWTKNSYYPTREYCDDDSGCTGYTDVSVWSYYQHQRTWWTSGY
jgi:hypothetical protein